ncbi:MAG: spore germination protein [Syntrophomonas sp.]
MLRSFTKILRILPRKPNNGKSQSSANSAPASLAKVLDNNLTNIRNILGQSSDVIIHKMKLGPEKTLDAAIIYIDGLVDKNLVNQDILRPLMFHLPMVENIAEMNSGDLMQLIKTSVLTVGDITSEQSTANLTDTILSGNTVVLLDGVNEAIVINLRGWEARSIEEAKNEMGIRGPRTSFVETLRTNTAMLRRIIRDPNLTFESSQIGQRSKTDVVIVYIKGVTPDSLIEEVRQRLRRINTDAILDVGYIEQFIEDSPISLFPTVANTERPDVAAARILEGRAAIIMDGSPFALTVPMLYMESFQNPEDYYARPYFTNLVRWLRFLSFELSIYLPAGYVALMSFHQELIPTPLLITVSAAREGLPLPVVFEALLMLILFEILREAGLRMPRSLGQAVSIVGALVIGQAAVSAGLVGAPMVVVLATTAIASFTVPSQADVGAVLRLLMVLIAGFIGVFGIVILSLELLSFMASMRSFGTPYFSPIMPLNFADLKDTLIRAPLWTMDNRPQTLNPSDSKRQGEGTKPDPGRQQPSGGGVQNK